MAESYTLDPIAALGHLRSGELDHDQERLLAALVAQWFRGPGGLNLSADEVIAFARKIDLAELEGRCEFRLTVT